MKAFFALAGTFCVCMALFLYLQIRSVAAWDREPETEQVYQVHMNNYRKDDPARESVRRLDGKLLEYTQNDGAMVSVWKDLETRQEDINPAARKLIKSMLHKPMLSRLQSGEAQHFIGSDFPAKFLGQQLQVLSPLLLAVKEGKERSDSRENKNVEVTYDERGSLLTLHTQWPCTDRETGVIFISELSISRKAVLPRLSGRPFLSNLSLPRADIQRLSASSSDKIWF